MGIFTKTAEYPRDLPARGFEKESAIYGSVLLTVSTLMVLYWFITSAKATSANKETKWPDNIQAVLDNTKPLKFDRGDRLPFYVWAAMDSGILGDTEAEELVRLLDKRGIGLICTWRPNNIRKSLAESLPIARAQKKLGLRININANHCLYSFFNGDEKTAHIDQLGNPFWDDSFGKRKMGCPFALDFRRDAIRNQLQPFVNKYKQENLPVDFIFADWEIDGPIEWNNAWKASKRCRRCRENVPDIDNFLAFQKSLRELRSELQRDVYAETILEVFPNALVGNYAVYPHNGYRYWYDYFEYYVQGQPALTDQRARYRHWYNEFPLTGYTFAMPVVYTWYPIFNWYDIEDADWRWFYNMLLVASNAGEHTPSTVPVITFVHWQITAPPKDADPNVKQFSKEKYQELLWHMLLRGHDTFFAWTGGGSRDEEIRLAHTVWAAAQEFGELLEKGTPVTFEVPNKPGPVVSGLRLGERVLIRRTDFTDTNDPVKVRVGSRSIMVPRNPGRCTIMPLK